MQKSKLLLLVGGGSGGHLTPLVSVSNAVASKYPEVRVATVGQKGENLSELTNIDSISKVYNISAGKFRRYNSKSLISHLIDVKTLLLNIRDFFRFILGFIQSYFLLRRIKPDAILLKGGFVCVPVGLAARLLRIPYITHDSDAIPGLANRITAKHAKYNATAMAIENYPYDKAKTVQTGIPLRDSFSKVDGITNSEFRTHLGFSDNETILFCSGGGQGSQNINRALVSISDKLIEQNNKLKIVHLTGKKLFSETKKLYENKLTSQQLNSVICIDFTSELQQYSAVADLIITRAGATSIAEFSAQQKACIVIPSPYLTGGQQLHNADILSKNNAAVIVDENKIGADLLPAISSLLNSNSKRIELSKNIAKLHIPDAEVKLADLLIEISKNK